MAMKDPWLEVATTSLGGSGFNVWLCFFVEKDRNGREIALLEQSTTFDKAMEKGLAVAEDVGVKLLHRFGKDGFEEITVK
jgi:hypothetical protein